MNRRTLFATLLAAVTAPFWPTPQRRDPKRPLLTSEQLSQYIRQVEQEMKAAIGHR